MDTNLLKFMIVDKEFKFYLSPLIMHGSFVASGMSVAQALEMSKKLIREVPTKGITEEQLFIKSVEAIPDRYRERFVTLTIVKRYLVSSKAKFPLFIFLGGLAGKTTLTGYIVQHLGINRVIPVDEEKYIVRARHPEAKHLWEATYEREENYLKITDSLTPRIFEKVEENLHDYADHKKWCYMWEGIYFLPSTSNKISEKYPDAHILSIFTLPKFEEIKNRYMNRWMQENGVKRVRSEKQMYDKYLNNILHIKLKMKKEIIEHRTFRIESESFEGQLAIFYGCLYQKLTEISQKELPGWVNRICKDPTEIHKFEDYLQS